MGCRDGPGSCPAVGALLRALRQEGCGVGEQLCLQDGKWGSGMDLGMWRITIKASVHGKPDFWTQLFHTMTKTIKRRRDRQKGKHNWMF